jgi:two-component system CheB/CheR fusion protein
VPDATPVPDAPQHPSSARCPLVGIGASAGGLEAFTRLLRHLPPDTGYAFVLVQHLDASHPSSLSEILGRATEMPVVEAGDNVTVAPNHVYVIPPNTELTVAECALRLAARPHTVRHMPVDHFLQSLAKDGGSGAVGVVLSGNGSDGAIGLRAVKDAGGLTFAQEPGSAEFTGMPAAAISAGGADLILPPESIAVELARIAHHPYFDAEDAPPPGVVPGVAVGEESLRAICDVIREATGIDFSLYRQTTVRRRILRRLAILNLTNVDEYAQLVRNSPDELAALQRDLLIGVTSFFRDPKAFEALKTLVFPAITRGRPADSTIRIWVPGCATGEEAYSILIALLEFQNESGTSFPVQVLASDINDAALEKARSGRYPESIAGDVGARRLSEFFVKISGAYQIAKSLRERCLFSRHNLLDDPPFSRLDLVSCRNVLIYLDTIQRKVIPLFHYALVDDGFLMLGRSETTHHGELFAAVDPIQKIYAKRQVAKRTYESFARRDRHIRGADAKSEAPPAAPGRSRPDLSRDVDRILLSRYSPSGVVVDESLEILEFRGRPAPFLGPTAGKAGLHLLKQVSDTELFLTIEKLIRETVATGEVARQERVPYDADGRSGEVNVEVTPLRRGSEQAVLVLFGTPDGDAGGSAPSGAVSPAIRDAQIAKLTREREAARARLLTFIDDKQISDDENQRIAEDALSANEELQSLTEELETAKEELQSTNEELLTVNRELESRNAALASALELTRSIVQSVAIPLVVIDNALLVRQMNPAFLKTFRLTDGVSEDQPFFGMCDGVWDVPSMRTRLDGLLAGGRSFDLFEVEREFPSLGLRTLVVGGVRLEHLGWMLLTIQDITGQREAEKALRSSEERRRQSEKMETVGRLAGGIAHDFNNLLTVIIGNAELLGEAEGLDQQAIEEVGEIRECAARAAALTDQLLAFSRRKVLQPKVFDLNPLIADFERMLRRLLGERIKIVVRPSTEHCWVRADSAEIGRVVLNLCLNARDAMPAGGVLTIETAHAALDERRAAEHGMPPGRYVRLVVADTGIGMDGETRRQVFEPFFTTKDVSKGAGLGLPSALGIVQQSGGVLVCESELGEGTRFEVLLPVAAEGEAAADRRHVGLKDVPRGASAVVLLVEDEDGVRGLTKRVLERAGYVVLEAADGRAALSVVEAESRRIDILVSDVSMPGMSGGALVEGAVKLLPGLKVLLVSGHTEDVLAKEGIAKGTPFLAKPYAPAELVRKVRAVLDA